MPAPEAPPSRPSSSLAFKIASASDHKLGPRLATLTLTRDDEPLAATMEIATPGLMTATSRGVVPHLSRDHVRATEAIRWVNVPFETFLEQSPPVPTLQRGPRPLHRFLGFAPAQHVVCMLARDPADARELPANGKDHISTYCVRGVRKLTPAAWRALASACNPDVVVALSDTPFAAPPHSQKRLTKSVERSAAWLADLLAGPAPVAAAHAAPAPENAPSAQEPNSNLAPPSDGPALGASVLVHMAGGVEAQARRAFAEALAEPLESRDLARLRPLARLDNGVAGYVFDLAPLRAALAADAELPGLLRASLGPLPPDKPRLAHSTRTPHEVLRLLRDVGVDLFDAHWAQRAADVGVALDFRFPVVEALQPDAACAPPRVREDGRRDLGHNLYSPRYAHDHSRFAQSFRGAAEPDASTSGPVPVCPCLACSPRRPSTRLRHSEVDVVESARGAAHEPPYTPAYAHHLLHTHEMSAHTLLVMHNLAVLDAFFAGVRAVLARPDAAAAFAEEVARFEGAYSEEMVVVEEAARDWLEVDLARGKGRLAREKVKQNQSTLGTAVHL